MQQQFHAGVVATQLSATSNFEQQKIGVSAERERKKAVSLTFLSAGRAIGDNFLSSSVLSSSLVLLCTLWMTPNNKQIDRKEYQRRQDGVGERLMPSEQKLVVCIALQGCSH